MTQLSNVGDAAALQVVTVQNEPSWKKFVSSVNFKTEFNF